MSDIDIVVVVNSLKTLDPNRPIREADIYLFIQPRYSFQSTPARTTLKLTELKFAVKEDGKSGAALKATVSTLGA